MLYRSIETASLITDRVLVSFSGGKDSVVSLDLCIKYFKEVKAFFMYQVGGLSFQEAIIKYYEDKYGIQIYRIPHFFLSEKLRYGFFRLYDLSVPILSVKDIYTYMRDMTGIYWIAAGERIKESLWRRGIIKGAGTIDMARGRFYPVAEWSKEEILSYIKQKKLKVGLDSKRLGCSFDSFLSCDLEVIRKHFPNDFDKIKSWFPFIEALFYNAKMREAQ